MTDQPAVGPLSADEDQVETLGPADAVAADVARDEPLDVLLKRAVEAFKALSPEEQQRQFDEQKRRWVAAEMAIGDEGTRCIPPTQPNTGGAAPGHTDLMVSPESIDAFLEANPLPDNTGGEVEASGAESVDLLDLDNIAESLSSVGRITDGNTVIAAAVEIGRLREALRPQPTAPAGETFTVDELAQEIRRVDGNRDLGAGALAEALTPFLVTKLVAYAARTTPAPSVDLAELKRWVEDYEQEAALDAEEDGDLSHVDDGLREFPLAKIKALIAQIERGEG